PGFALESFDPIGGWGDDYRALDPEKPGLLIDGGRVKYVYSSKGDAGDGLADGRKFADVREVKKLLLGDPEPIVENVAAQMLVYALGREPDAADREELRAIVDRLQANDYGLRSLVKEIAASDAFATR